MAVIRLMSTVLANQIAAGEVVVRPASCVKELIENSLDAGATAIVVSLVEGGIASISVQDDGGGMDEADALMAFCRHATSKVYDERDLARIHTLGFRGEALASIAAVAKVTLTTRRSEDERATQVQVSGGEMEPVQYVGAAPGTTIEVKDLFYNTPARLKYLRTVQTEQAKSVEVVQKAALSRPDVAFTCQTEHHVLFQTQGNGDVRAVLAALYGAGEAKQLVQVKAATPDYNVLGYVGRPTQGRASRAHAHLFVNGRPVRNIGVHQSVIQGYKNRLMVGKQPIYALAIEMDPSLVDVNVHPHKEEVRFSEEADVTRLISRAVAGALDELLLAPTPESARENRVPDTRPARNYSEIQPLALEWSPPADRTGEERELSGETGRPSRASGNQRSEITWKKPAGISSQQVSAARESALAYPKHQNSDGQAVTRGVLDEAKSPDGHGGSMAADPTRRKEDWRLRPIGQALGMYVIADDGESLYIIDQHAAHERILFEEFYGRLSAQSVHSMPLLAPLSVTLTPTLFERAMKHQDWLSGLGLSFDHFGGYDILIRTVPDVWEGLDTDRLAVETLEHLPEETGDETHFYQVMHGVIATRACKAAVKANWYLSTEELAALCHALTTLDDPFHCPHGRPIFLRWTDKQLEKEFRRIV